MFKLSNFFSAMLGVIIGVGVTLTVIVPQANKVSLTNNSNNEINKTQNQEVQSVEKETPTNSNIYKNVIKTAMPSVVGITTVFLDDKSQDSYFEFFFGGGDKPQIKQGLGTGVIVDKTGYILTNAHVIEDGKAKKVNVLFNNGETKEAKVKWFDESLDLAIIKVDGGNYVPAKLGDSSKVEVGDIAIAIGNPLGLQFERTVTQGIISGIDRTVQTGQATFMSNLLQTDASINRGNSGGPLLNEKGEVIGINTVKAAGGEGLGFSIAINTAKIFVDIIEKNGDIKDKPVLGIKGTSVAQLKGIEDIKTPVKEGVYVYSVFNDSPASKAGLKKGDIIVKMQDDKIRNMYDIQANLYKNGQDISKPITIVVNRNSKEENIKIQLISEKDFEKQQKKQQNPLILFGNS